MATTDFAQIRADLLKKTREDIASAIGTDIYVMQTLAAIDELTVQLNTCAKRLREWHAYLLPEVDNVLDDNEAFVRMVTEKTYKELKDEFVKAQPMGAAPGQQDYGPIRLFASQINDLYVLKSSLLDYLEQTLIEYAPNMQSLAGTTIAARLLASAGSLRKLAILPSSTIQLFGAEKALFRHLKTGARSPKHGHIFNHPIVQHASREDGGKAARALADKLSLCAKIDYFKGETTKGKEYLKELQERF